MPALAFDTSDPGVPEPFPALQLVAAAAISVKKKGHVARADVRIIDTSCSPFDSEPERPLS
ncbi:MAG TPA: hypothetical protein VNW92_13500 [Polyangiaceae bacterium]|nr:hypothetical protein [Polyangiaceae bacterium]